MSDIDTFANEAAQRQEAAIKQRQKKVQSVIDHYLKEHEEINQEVALLLPRLMGFHGSNSCMFAESRMLALLDRNSPLCRHSRIAIWDTNMAICFLRGWAYVDEDLMEGRRLLRPSDVKARNATDSNLWGSRKSKYSTPIPIRIAKN